MTADAAVSIVTDAPALRVWELVADVTRMGQWSPETTSCRWVGGASRPEVGARFRGANRRGWHRWTTSCRVVSSVPGERFVFDVTLFGMPVAEWGFTMSPQGDQTRVDEWFVDRRSPLVRFLGRVGTGVADRRTHNLATMEATLTAVVKAASATG
jgi:uncharacterized protein YndB with AHSA1/START domain